MCNYSQAIEIIGTISSITTPVLVLIIGIIVTKNLEKNKLEVLKEKEWQVKWSELFFSQAICFNNNISNLVFGLHRLQTVTDPVATAEISQRIHISFLTLSQVEWNIKNYTRFAPDFGKKVEELQSELMGKLVSIIKERKGDLEEIRLLQFAYNEAIRSAHAEMLKS